HFWLWQAPRSRQGVWLAQVAPSGVCSVLHAPPRQTCMVRQSKGPQPTPSTALTSPQPLAGSQKGTLHGADGGGQACEYFTQPCAGSQRSSVQALPSSQLISSPLHTPAAHWPCGTHLLVQATPSSEKRSTQTPASALKLATRQSASGLQSSGGSALA